MISLSVLTLCIASERRPVHDFFDGFRPVEIEPHQHPGEAVERRSVSAALAEARRLEQRLVPTYAIVRFTFSPRLSTGYPSIAGAPRFFA